MGNMQTNIGICYEFLCYPIEFHSLEILSQSTPYS
jgi:hypothetical protein